VLSLVYLVNADSNEDMKNAAVVADQLSAAGFDVQLQPLSGSVQSDALLRGQYTIAQNAFCPGYIYDNLELFHSKFFVPLGEPAPWYERNSFRYQNPEFDAIVDQMAQLTPDDPQNIELYKQAVEILLRDLPVIPFVQAPALVPFNDQYWTGWPNADNAWNMPVSWWATFNLVINGYPNPDTGEWVGGIKSTQTALSR
jgi:peptide/nickel transport system substrate-binding protein